MTHKLNNRQLSRSAGMIFANDTAYFLELPMAGRQTESQTMRRALSESHGPRLVTMTASLGAGKTFFLNKMIARHADEAPEFDERRNCRWVFATNEVPGVDAHGAHAERRAALCEAAGLIEAGFDRALGLRVLIVEELDRKASLEQLLWSVEAAVEWLTLGGERLLVLSGEAMALPLCQERLANIEVRFDIALKALDLALLKEALTARIAHVLIKPANAGISDLEARALAESATDAVLRDEYIRWAAVPAADPPKLPNFREAMGALGELSQIVVVEDDSLIDFPRRLLAHFASSAVGSGMAGRLEAAVLMDVAARIATSGTITAMSIEDLAGLLDSTGDEKFRRRAIEPLSRVGLLIPLGVPYSLESVSGKPLMYVEPFMPSYSMVHRALAYLVSSG